MLITPNFLLITSEVMGPEPGFWGQTVQVKIVASICVILNKLLN